MGQDWARIGVHLDAHFVPQASFTAGYDSGGILSRGAFQIATLNFSAGGDPGGQFPALESGYIPWVNPEHSGVNYSGIRDPLIDRAFAHAESSFSHNVQRAAYGLVQSEINRKAHWIPLYFVPQIWTEDGRVAGVSWNPSLGTALWNPSAVRLKTGVQP